MKNLLLLFVICLGTSFTAQAQSKKLQEKAMEKVTELNDQLVTISADLALSDAQQKQIMELELGKMQDQRSINKMEDLEDDEQKEKKKEARKEYRKAVNKILTKEQRKALKENKE